MGSSRSARTKLISRCCYGAVTILTLTGMFWIAWCFFGLTVVQMSEAQRRALVNYSHVSPDTKPLPTPTTAAPSRSTTLATEETSVNSISKLPTTASVLRGSNRGELQPKTDKRKEADIISSLAKGDFASRDRVTQNSNATASKDVSTSAISSPRGQPRTNVQRGHPEFHVSVDEKAAILTGSSAAESEEDRIYARRVLSSGAENRPEEKIESSDHPMRRHPPEAVPDSRHEISPTKVYDVDVKSESSRRPDEPVDRSRSEGRTEPRDYVARDKTELPRDDIQSSRRPDTGSVYREPHFDREPPRRRISGSDRGRPGYDDLDDDRGSRGRYDKRDRGRESDDRYPKGDTRVYPDDRDLPSPREDRNRERARERYSDDKVKKGDDDRYDDRYRDYDERPRQSDRDSTRDRDRDSEDRPPVRDDLFRDDERYRTRDDRYRDRDDDKYKSRDEDRYRSRDDDGYRSRDEDRYRPRDEGRYVSRDDDRYRSRDDERYRSRDDERYRDRDDDRFRSRDDDKRRDEDRYKIREEDRYKSREDDRYRSDLEDRRDTSSRFKEEKDGYRKRLDDDKHVEVSISRLKDIDTRESVSRSSSNLPVGEKKSTSSHSAYNFRSEDTVTDYDIPVHGSSRSYESSSRLPRPSYDEERYRERSRDNDYRRPSRDESDRKDISPTKTREESPLSRSPLIDSRSKGLNEDSRYIDSQRDRLREDDRYYDLEDRIRSTGIQDSRSSVSESVSSRRYSDDNERYRTRLPNERPEDSKLSDRRVDVVLDRRSYSSEEDEEYRRRNAGRGNEDRNRRPIEDTRRRDRDDESYSRRDPTDDDEYRRRRISDDYDRRNDDRYDSRDEYRYSSRDDRSSPLPVRRSDADEKARRRDPVDDEAPRRRDPVDDERHKRRDPVDDERPRRRDPVDDERPRRRDPVDDERPRRRDPVDDERPRRRDRIDEERIRRRDPVDDERSRRRDPDLSGSRKEDSQDRGENLKSSSSSRDEYLVSKPPPRRHHDDDLSLSDSRDYLEDRRYSETSRKPTNTKEPTLGSSMTVYSREPSDVVVREKRFQTTENRYQSRRTDGDEAYDERSTMDDESSRSREQVRPLSAKDVIEAAIRHSDASDQNSRKVPYPVFDPNLSNLTSPGIILAIDRRGTTMTAKKRRSA